MLSAQPFSAVQGSADWFSSAIKSVQLAGRKELPALWILLQIRWATVSRVVQSLLALGTGGLFGLGLGKSIQKNLYLPEPQNDFILAIIGEELGLVGILVLFVVYAVLIWRCFHICLNAPDRFGMLLSEASQL